MVEINQEQINNESFLDEIKRLSLLDKIKYELIRDQSANKFSVRVSMLDEFVEEKRKKLIEKDSEIHLFPMIEPWSEAVSLSELLDEIVKILEKYVSFISEHEPRAVALWIIHTYCIDTAYITPILFITSAEMRSGKSTLLAILQKTVWKCVAASSVSPSVIFRLIHKHHPTLICDEADTYLTGKNEDLRGVLNAGHSRDTSGILRTNPDTLEPERFDAFGAKCFAAIKDLPCTIEDRSIIIKMRRMTKDIKKEKMRFIDKQLKDQLLKIQQKGVRFANDNTSKLDSISPTLPDKLNARAADNWHVLFQIAELAGDDWLGYARRAALSLSQSTEENKSLGIELLEDIQNVFDGEFKHLAEIPTIELINTLCNDEEAPWATYNNKKQDTKITPRQLAKLLSPYAIKTINNIGYGKRKGYSKISFYDAFLRYVYPNTSGDTAIPALSAIHSNDEGCECFEANTSSAISRSTSSLIVAGADNSGLEQRQIQLQTQSNTDVATIADKNEDMVSDCVYV